LSVYNVSGRFTQQWKLHVHKDTHTRSVIFPVMTAQWQTQRILQGLSTPRKFRFTKTHKGPFKKKGKNFLTPNENAHMNLVFVLAASHDTASDYICMYIYIHMCVCVCGFFVNHTHTFPLPSKIFRT